MIHFNGRPVSEAGVGDVSQGTTTRGGALGLWPWGSQWRYFFGMENGRVVSQEGPFWLSDYAASAREADIVERGLAQGRALNPVRYDWDESARTWRAA